MCLRVLVDSTNIKTKMFSKTKFRLKTNRTSKENDLIFIEVNRPTRVKNVHQVN